MSIIGIGLDATELARIDEMLQRYGERFTRRVFTAGEIEYCTRRRFPVPHFAGRFAAKEAAMKALGTGHSRGVIWKDVEIVRRGGPPTCSSMAPPPRTRRVSASGARSSRSRTHRHSPSPR